MNILMKKFNLFNVFEYFPFFRYTELMSEKLSPELKNTLCALAKKYETVTFMDDDPSQFTRRYSEPLEQEIASFITAQLSFGRRDQFIAKLNSMFDEIKTVPSEWLVSGGYKNFFPKSQKKFYRFYSYSDMNALCAALTKIISQYGTLGEAVRLSYRNKIQQLKGIESDTPEQKLIEAKKLALVTSLIGLFPGVKPVSQNPKSACKRLHMFLRWMVRRNSPVDLGLWTWASPKDLLIPLDVHVMRQSIELELIPPKSTATAKTAILLTQRMAEIWQDDPACGDFALFGLGINSTDKKNP